MDDAKDYSFVMLLKEGEDTRKVFKCFFWNLLTATKRMNINEKKNKFFFITIYIKKVFFLEIKGVNMIPATAWIFKSTRALF